MLISFIYYNFIIINIFHIFLPCKYRKEIWKIVLLFVDSLISTKTMNIIYVY